GPRLRGRQRAALLALEDCVPPQPNARPDASRLGAPVPPGSKRRAAAADLRGRDGRGAAPPARLPLGPLQAPLARDRLLRGDRVLGHARHALDAPPLHRVDAPAGSAAHEAASRTSAAPVLIDRYMRYLSVEEIRGTDIVEVRFATPDPSLSALLAAAHTQAYLDTNEEARRANDVTAQEFLGR